MPRTWAVAAWVTCGLVWSLGLATIGLAVAGRVPPQQFVTGFMALGPLFGMPAALLGARISSGDAATGWAGSCWP